MANLDKGKSRRSQQVIKAVKGSTIQNVTQAVVSGDITGYQIKNMAGNVLEWTISDPLPLSLMPKENGKDAPIIVRGGSWENERSAGLASNRGIDSILSARDTSGFRCTCPEGKTCKSPWNWIWIWFRQK